MHHLYQNVPNNHFPYYSTLCTFILYFPHSKGEQLFNTFSTTANTNGEIHEFQETRTYTVRSRGDLYIPACMFQQASKLGELTGQLDKPALRCSTCSRVRRLGKAFLPCAQQKHTRCSVQTAFKKLHG